MVLGWNWDTVVRLYPANTHFYKGSTLQPKSDALLAAQDTEALSLTDWGKPFLGEQ